MLRCEHISVRHAEVEALRSIDIHVEQAEVVALIGSNGAGKTTLLRTISGLHRPSEGVITFAGTSLSSSVAPEKRVKMGIAHVPEGRRIFPGLTVAENLEVATSSWRKRGQKISEDLQNVFDLFPRLKERRKQLGWSLSGGEQQMLAIARSLMSRPKLLLLDEPSLGLSPRLAEELYERIDLISRAGMTVLVVEQNTTLALEISQRTYVLANGSIVLDGTSRDIASDSRVKTAYLGV